MYFRLKKTKSSDVLQLVKAYRDHENKPRQKILLSLGEANLPKEIWKAVAEEVENRIKGISSFLKPSQQVSEWAEKIFKAITKKNTKNLQDEGTQESQSNIENITVNVAEISHSDTTELGSLLPIMKAWDSLKFTEVFSNLGWNPVQIRDIMVSVFNRLLDPCSENGLADWVATTSLGDLLNTPMRKLKKDRFYRVTDLLHKHKETIEKELRGKEVSLFDLEETIILYDMTNTYFEGICERNTKSQRGMSKEKRSDAPLLSIALVLDGEGFLIRHDIFEGNRHDSVTLLPIIKKLQKNAGSNKKPLIILDSGFASESNLAELRKKKLDYIVVGKRPTRIAYSEEFKTFDFDVIKDREKKPSVKIAIKETEDENILLCQSESRGEKEKAIISKAEDRYLKDLEKLKSRIDKGRLKNKNTIQKSLGKLLERHSRVSRYYQVDFDEKSFLLTWTRIDEKYESALAFSGSYYLRTSRKDLKKEEIWKLYMTLTRVEYGFKTLKSYLGLRPVYHQREDRCDSHIFITTLAYRLLHWIEYTLRKEGDKRSWPTIRRLLKTHAYTTITLPSSTEDKVIHFRIPGTPEVEQGYIYDLLKINYLQLPKRRFSLN